MKDAKNTDMKKFGEIITSIFLREITLFTTYPNANVNYSYLNNCSDLNLYQWILFIHASYFKTHKLLTIKFLNFDKYPFYVFNPHKRTAVSVHSKPHNHTKPVLNLCTVRNVLSDTAWRASYEVAASFYEPKYLYHWPTHFYFTVIV